MMMKENLEIVAALYRRKKKFERRENRRRKRLVPKPGVWEEWKH